MSEYFISEHISYYESVKSQTAERMGIKNIPSDKQIANMKYVAKELFEPLRQWWGRAIGVSSFFRNLELNHAIGGSATSQHCLGLAIDLDADMYHNGLTNKMIFTYFKNRIEIFDFDQLIYEFGDDTNPSWVHISKLYKDNRNEMLRASWKNKRVIYKRI